MSNITAIILSFLQLALRLLDTVDKAAADDFRRSVALDVLLGCSSANWAERTQIPSTPILASIRKVNLDRIDGVWMDSRDAGTLAQWINDVEQVKARY